MDGSGAEAVDEVYTLLALRADGVSPVVDLVAATTLKAASLAAQAMLREHASCATVEVWRDGVLLDKVSR